MKKTDQLALAAELAVKYLSILLLIKENHCAREKFAAPEANNANSHCIASDLRWFCEGKELENSPDIQIITNGELHSLIIAEAFEEDTGRYSCFASNFYGTDSTSAEIYVEGDSSLYFSSAVLRGLVKRLLSDGRCLFLSSRCLLFGL